MESSADIIDEILEANPHLDIAAYYIIESDEVYQEYDSNETEYIIEQPLNDFEKFDRKYDFVKKGDCVKIYRADEGAEDWTIPALEKCENIVIDGDWEDYEDPDYEPDLDVLLVSSGISSSSDLNRVRINCSFGTNALLGPIYDSELIEKLKDYFEKAIVEGDYLLGFGYRDPP